MKSQLITKLNYEKILILYFGCILSLAQAQIIHVSANAPAGGDGSLKKPFAKILFLIWGDDAGKLFYLPLPTHVRNRAFLFQVSKETANNIR